MNYATIKYCDIANGEGVRTSLFVSGCRRHCPNCFNAVAWDFNYGEPFTKEVRNKILESLAPGYINGLSLLGGEPFLMVSPGQRIRQITDRVLAEAGVKPRVLLTSRNYELLRRLTSEGMGCMLLPSRYVGLLGGEGYQPAYYMIPPKYRAWWALSVVRLREAYLSRAAEAFLASFKAHLTEDEL